MPPQNDMPDLFVVDGSNLATEGRDKPSLQQLEEALTAFREEYSKIELTVVVDATFGHRIDKKEAKAFDRAVARNEIVTPPAGAVGRGDAFVLAIAEKAGAGVLSNDSFQEFHGEYGWLFDHGRLIGGKPVPHVGWVFVDRNPVRGPRSRQSVKAARSKAAAAKASDDAKRSDDTTDTTGSTDTVAPKRAAKRRGGRRSKKQQATETGTAEAAPAQADADTKSADTKSSSSSSSQVNDLMPFLDFVEQHPVGTPVTGTVDSYSSHGAYARVADVLVYVPLRLMADPPPSSARKVLALGDEVEMVISRYVPDRRSIDAALPAMAPAGDQPAKRAAAKKSAAKKTGARKAAAKKSAAKKTTAAKKTAATTAAKKTAAKTTTAKKAAAKKSAAKKTAAKSSAARKTTAAKKSAAKKTTPAKKAAAKRSTGSRRSSTS